MKSLSVCILAKNEENNISDCINSIKSIADEIIVVDNASSDNTKQIAKALGSTVLDGSDFILDEARELYLKVAKYEWILIIDADERFEKKENIGVKEFLSKTPDDVWGYEVLSYQHLGKGKWSEIYLLRLIRNNGEICYNNSPIHSSMIPSILNNDATIESTDLFVIHHLDILIPGRPQPKRKRYRVLLEDLISQEKQILDMDMMHLYKCFLGLEYIAINAFDEAEKIYQEIINESSRYQKFALQFLCQLYMYIGDFDKVKRYIIKENVSLFEKSGVLGNYYLHLDKKMATEYYEKAIEHRPYVPSNYLNLSYLLQDSDEERARELLKIATIKNSFLLNKLAYVDGEEPNLFKVQSNILFVIKDVRVLLKNLGLICLVE